MEQSYEMWGSYREKRGKVKKGTKRGEINHSCCLIHLWYWRRYPLFTSMLSVYYSSMCYSCTFCSFSGSFVCSHSPTALSSLHSFYFFLSPTTPLTIQLDNYDNPSANLVNLSWLVPLSYLFLSPCFCNFLTFSFFPSRDKGTIILFLFPQMLFAFPALSIFISNSQHLQGLFFIFMFQLTLGEDKCFIPNLMGSLTTINGILPDVISPTYQPRPQSHAHSCPRDEIWIHKLEARGLPVSQS